MEKQQKNASDDKVITVVSAVNGLEVVRELHNLNCGLDLSVLGLPRDARFNWIVLSPSSHGEARVFAVQRSDGSGSTLSHDANKLFWMRKEKSSAFDRRMIWVLDASDRVVAFAEPKVYFWSASASGELELTDDVGRSPAYISSLWRTDELAEENTAVTLRRVYTTLCLQDVESDTDCAPGKAWMTYLEPRVFDDKGAQVLLTRSSFSIEGFFVLRGEPGTGKTTLLRYLANHYDKSCILFYVNVTDALHACAATEGGSSAKTDPKLLWTRMCLSYWRSMQWVGKHVKRLPCGIEEGVWLIDDVPNDFSHNAKWLERVFAGGLLPKCLVALRTEWKACSLGNVKENLRIEGVRDWSVVFTESNGPKMVSSLNRFAAIEPRLESVLRHPVMLLLLHSVAKTDPTFCLNVWVRWAVRVLWYALGKPDAADDAITSLLENQKFADDHAAVLEAFGFLPGKLGITGSILCLQKMYELDVRELFRRRGDYPVNLAWFLLCGDSSRERDCTMALGMVLVEGKENQGKVADTLKTHWRWVRHIASASETLGLTYEDRCSVYAVLREMLDGFARKPGMFEGGEQDLLELKNSLKSVNPYGVIWRVLGY